MDRRGVLSLLGLGTVGVFLPAPAQAAVARARSVRDHVVRSRFAVLATALSRESTWAQVGDSRRIVTITRARVEELVTGSQPETSEVLIQTLGGRVGKVGQLVDGEADFTVGETSLVFARELEVQRFGVTAMAQGHYPLALESRGHVLRPSRSLPVLVGPDDSAVRKLSGVLLPDALRIIRSERP